LLVDFERSLYLEFILHVEDHAHSWIESCAVSIDVGLRARDMKSEAPISLCFIRGRINTRQFTVHVIASASNVRALRPALSAAMFARGFTPAPPPACC